LVLTLNVVSATIAQSSASLPPIPEIPGYYIQEKVPSPSLATNQLGPADVQDVLVYLPPSYADSPGRHYPVIYLLHGYTGYHTYFTSAGGPNLLAQAMLGHDLGLDVGTMEEKLVASGEMNEAILVMPNALNAYGGNLYGNSPLIGDYPAFIAEDLVSYIDSKYRTIADRRARGIAGHSMGGYGALTIAMRYPDVFGAVAAMSPGHIEEATARVYKPEELGQPVVIRKAEDLWALADPKQREINGKYAIAAAWTPNLKNPPYFVDLPTTPEVAEVWKKHKLLYLLPRHGWVLAGTPVLVTAGTGEAVLMKDWPEACLNLVKALQTQGIEASYQGVDGDHLTGLPAMTATSLKFLSAHLTPPIESELEANKTLHRRLFEEVWNEGKLYVADEIYSDDYIYHPLFPNPMGDMDKEERKLFIAAYLNAFPDLHFTIEDQIAEGDLVATRWTATGTQKGELMGIPPLGKPEPGTTTGIDIARIVDGKVVEVWACFDMLGMLEQIGAVPPTRENYTWGEPSKVTGEPGTPEENKAIAEKTLEFWNQKNLAVIDEIWSPEFIAHHPSSGSPLDFESFKQGCLAYITALPDLHAVHDETIAEGDKIVCRWTSTGTHLGKLMGIPPTGKKVTYTGITITRFADGKIVEQWWTMDTLGLMQQLGVIPPMQPKDYSNVFFMTLSPGLNMISLPLEPQTPYTARSLAEKLSATAVIKLDETRQKFVGWTPDAPDDGFPIQGGKGYIVNLLEGKVVAFTGAAWTQPPMPPAAPSILSDAWAFVLSGRLKGKFESGCVVTVRNIRTGEMATDTVRSGYFAVAFADLSRRSVVHVGDRLEVQVRDRFGRVISEPFIFEVRPESIRKAALSVVLDSVGLPDRTELLQNYPNPFNPETWIPYKLAEAGDVMIRIYDLSGRLIRRFDLGHKEPGFYVGRGRAVYWNGRNDAGERVSSGVYVVELRSGDFRATRRMMLVK